jgi:hypothetical protein
VEVPEVALKVAHLLADVVGLIDRCVEDGDPVLLGVRIVGIGVIDCGSLMLLTPPSSRGDR